MILNVNLGLNKLRGWKLLRLLDELKNVGKIIFHFLFLIAHLLITNYILVCI